MKKRTATETARRTMEIYYVAYDAEGTEALVSLSASPSLPESIKPKFRNGTTPLMFNVVVEVCADSNPEDVLNVIKGKLK